ncbi:MAG: hypothetical protein ABDI07_12260, partial [Candidatus Kryptonium sp.]
MIVHKERFYLSRNSYSPCFAGASYRFGRSSYGPLAKRIKINETWKTSDAEVEAVISHSAGSRCLPGNLTSANVRKLNDAWNKPLIYIFAPELSIGG